jgi:hypothetical protein
MRMAPEVSTVTWLGELPRLEGDFDWPPIDSAWRYEEGTRKLGSTGQLWEVHDQRWVRINEPPRST